MKSDEKGYFARRWLWIAIVVTVFKLWLTRGQPVYAIGMAGHDERLFLTLAENIVQGRWLGSYDQMTLAKGPFYSLWVAVVFWIGVPLNLAQQIAYAGACAIFTMAAFPAIRSMAARLAIYLLLLWNPMTYEAPTLGRVLRQNIYTPLTLFIFAGLVALYFRRQESIRSQSIWAALLGFSLGAFWLTREESVWIVPSVLLLFASIIVGSIHSRADMKKSGWSGLIALICAIIPIFAVSWKNHREYGWFGTVETSSSAFQDAYGAMMRVKAGSDLPMVPVTREARDAMYGVSPAFAQLKPYFEGSVGLGWANASAYVTKLPADQRQIGGGWLMWALRDTVKAAGHANTAGEAIRFYRQLATEINAACDDGRLAARPPRSGFLPPWHDGQVSEVAHTFWNFVDFFTSFKGFGAYAPPSIGGDDVLTLFRDMTGEPLSPSVDATNLPLPNQDIMGQRKLSMLQKIGKFLRPVLLGLFCLAQLIATVRLGHALWRRQWSYPLALAAAAWGGCFAYLLLNAIIQVTSFPLIAVSSFAPAYPLLIIFIVAAFWDAATARWRVSQTRAAASPK